jgi:hypothetical protein
VFGDRANGTYLPKFSWTEIVRHVMVKGAASPDDHGSPSSPDGDQTRLVHASCYRGALSSCWMSSVMRVSWGAGGPDWGLCQLAVGSPTTSFQVAKREVISRR